MLAARREENLDPESLVFPTPTGLAIDDHNFSRRAWKSVLGKAKVPYRKLYNTRHTAISHCLEAGMPPVLVAQMTGHDVQTLYEHYAAAVSSRPVMPEWY
jgi:integrase